MKIFNSFFLKSQYKNTIKNSFIKYKSSQLVEVIKSQVSLI